VVFRVTVLKTGADRAVTVSSPIATKSTAARPTSLLEFDDIKLCNVVPDDVDPIQAAIAVHDLAQLMQLHEASILHAVHARFELDCIYTCTGRILLAVNPFRAVPLYGDDVLDMYVPVWHFSCCYH
jgi:myosin heavy subunit